MSLLTCWLGFNQVGLEPYWCSPTGEQQPISWAFAQFQGFGLTLARLVPGSAGAGPRLPTPDLLYAPACPFHNLVARPVPAYLITSSAWKSSVGSRGRPMAWAVLRLMTSSNFVGCSTGRSVGLAPFRILST